MKIAQIAPIIERVPPKKYGGTERVVSALTEELVRRGHDVTLFASGDSVTSAKLVSSYPMSLREANVNDLKSRNVWSLLNIGTAYGRQDEFDILHDHNGPLALPTANMAHVPVVMTLHGRITRESKKIFQEFRNPYLVTISHSQMYPAPTLRYAGMVYNGLPMDHYPFSDRNEGYLLFVGRISMLKGVHFAIQVAQQLDLPLIIAAKVESGDRPYFEQYVEPFLSDRIRWTDEVDEAQRNELMSKALCFLHPAMWREPFGLVLIEAMACGCPVVAFDKGAIPEVIKNGETGFVVDDAEAMADAVKEIATIDRAACRHYALEHFSAQRMADEYEKVYRRILAKEI